MRFATVFLESRVKSWNFLKMGTALRDGRMIMYRVWLCEREKISRCQANPLWLPHAWMQHIFIVIWLHLFAAKDVRHHFPLYWRSLHSFHHHITIEHSTILSNDRWQMLQMHCTLQTHQMAIKAVTKQNACPGPQCWSAVCVILELINGDHCDQSAHDLSGAAWLRRRASFRLITSFFFITIVHAAR